MEPYLFSFLSKCTRLALLLFTALVISKPATAQSPVASANNEPSASTQTNTPVSASTTSKQIEASTASKIQSTDSNGLSQIEKLALQAKARAHLKAVRSLKHKNTEVKEVPVSPYEQLVKLAFKGKGVNGINGYKDAVKQFCQQARDNNNAEAQFALGWMYANGKGVDKDENIAAFFYQKAAAQNNYRAIKALTDFKGNDTLAKVPACMLPNTPKPQPVLQANILAPAGSSGHEFYKRGPIFEIVNRLAPQYHIETDLAMAFIKIESNFNPRATSPKNAQGLMQLIPATAKRFNVRDPYDPEDNIKGGLAYLQWLMAYFEGNVRLVAAAYNAGENAVNRYKGVPPYRETKHYVSKIYKLYRKSYHPFRHDLLVGQRSHIIHISSNN